MRILITGGGGFVGWQVRRVGQERGHAVVASDVHRSEQVDVELDVLDGKAVADRVAEADVVVHCASVVGPVPARENPIKAVDVNVMGTAHVVEAARRHGKRVVYLSTATLYGTRPDLKPLHESDVPAPVSHYDATKYAAEVVSQSYRKDFDVNVVCVRTGFVYGPGHSTGEYFVESVMRGEPVTQETGADQPCDFTYVKDLARGLVLAAEQQALPEPIYNVTGGVLRTRGEFADAVRGVLPKANISIGPGVNPTMHLRGACVLDLARRDFGYAPEFDLEAGIADWVGEAERQEVVK
jgi:UDP-glucuronate 4-epimerase